MHRTLGLVAITLTSMGSTASADAIGPCPDGQRVVTNPTSPGAMHHGGFHCEPDPSASRCSALPGSDDSPLAALGVFGSVALIATRRRARTTA